MMSLLLYIVIYQGGESMKTSLYIEYYEKQISEADLIKTAKSIWTDSGKKASDLKSLSVYLKPEDNKAYYVFNDNETGSFDIN